MKADNLKQFVTLRATLHQEKSSLEARLREINQVLGESPEAGSPAAPVARAGAKRKISAAGKARIAAAQRARWAKLKADAKTQAGKPKAKRKLSAKARARISTATKARWARVRAGK